MFLKRFLKKNKEVSTEVMGKKLNTIETTDITIEKYKGFQNLSTLIIPDFLISSSNSLDKYFKINSELMNSSDEFIDQEKLSKGLSPEDFEHLSVLGKGYFGKVSKVKFKKTGEIYAMKSLRKDKLKKAKQIEHTKAEKKVLEIIHHPFIVEMRFAFQTETKLYIVMDYYSGGELFYLLKSFGRFDESMARFYFAQIVTVFEFLHGENIIYRDLKPENIVIDDDGYLKLTDFGLAKENIVSDEGTETFCGTSEYLAPEIILGERYGKKVDIWALGIFLYEMLFGFPPFIDKNKDRLYNKILTGTADFNNIIGKGLSKDVKSLINDILKKEPKSRPKLKKIKEHPFFKEIKWNDILMKKIKPPFKPSTKTEFKYFDQNLINQIPEDSFINVKDPHNPKDFEGFSYTNNQFI